MKNVEFINFVKFTQIAGIFFARLSVCSLISFCSIQMGNNLVHIDEKKLWVNHTKILKYQTFFSPIL